MATFGTIASAQPNVLFNPMAVDQAVQGLQRNQLMLQNSRQDQAQQTLQRDAEARIGMARELSNLPETDAAAQWPTYRQRLQSAGLGQGLPEQFPGMARIRAVASSDLTTFQRMQMEERAQGRQAIQGLFAEAPAASVAPVAAPATPSAPVAAPGAAPVPTAAMEPRGIRNNNPLNLSFAGQPGAVMEEHATPRFARFETPEAGIAASINQLRLYQRRGNTTLAGMINTWAPPSENDTRGYVQRVATMTGLAPDQPVNLDDPAVAARLVQAMARIETGRDLAPEVAQRGVAARTGGTDVAGPGAGPGQPAAASPAPPAPSGNTPVLITNGPPVLRGLTQEQAATLRAMSTVPGATAQSLLSQAESMRQHNQTLIRQTETDARLARTETRTVEQQAEQGRRADEAARRADEAARRAETTAAQPAEGERRAASYLERMNTAEQMLQGLTQREGYSPGNIQDRVAQHVPGFLGGNFLVTEPGQRYLNAAAEWARAKLRLESGAVISDAEAREEARTYFPMPGDSPATIAQKEELRRNASAAIRIQAGRAAGQADATTPRPSGQPAPPATGTVEDGYRFRGGNPGDPASWERVQ